MNDTQIHQLLTTLDRIAGAVEILVAAQVPAPNYKRPMREYKNFDWGAINARAIARDTHGPTQVEWNGRLFTRRNSTDKKKGSAIWYSCVVSGTVSEGNVKWGRLITFKDSASDPEPLDEKIARQAAQPAPQCVVDHATGELVDTATARQAASQLLYRDAGQLEPEPTPAPAQAEPPRGQPAPITDPADARQRFYALAGESISQGRVDAQAVNELVRQANGQGFAKALAALETRLSQ